MLLQKLFSTLTACTMAALLLTGCSPKFDWREAKLDDLGIRILLPGKSATMERNINLAGLPLKMTMIGAKVDDLSFTVAAALIPPPQSVSSASSTPVSLPTTTASYLEAMQQQMLRNVGAATAAATPVQIRLIDAAGKPLGQIPGSQIKVKGKVGDRSVTMRAVFCRAGERLIQAVVLGSDWNDEASQQFFDSFKIEQRP